MLVMLAGSAFGMKTRMLCGDEIEWRVGSDAGDVRELILRVVGGGAVATEKDGLGVETQRDEVLYGVREWGGEVHESFGEHLDLLLGSQDGLAGWLEVARFTRLSEGVFSELSSQ